jgi:hypothetical protein
MNFKCGRKDDEILFQRVKSMYRYILAFTSLKRTSPYLVLSPRKSAEVSIITYYGEC